jgi:HEAT repeat protein
MASFQALQLLDRRLMDPKVRAFAAHCLEELPDDQLALFMLQLVQQVQQLFMWQLALT